MAKYPGIKSKQFKSKDCIFSVFVVPKLSSVPDSIRCSTCLLNKGLMPQSQKGNLNIYILYMKTNTTKVKKRVRMIKSLLAGAENLCEWRLNGRKRRCIQIRKHGFWFHLLKPFNLEQMSPWVSVSSYVEWNGIIPSLFTLLVVVMMAWKILLMYQVLPTCSLIFFLNIVLMKTLNHIKEWRFQCIH